MRSLIIRFLDAEGPGLIGDILYEKGYQVTFHNAYEKGLHLIPQAHQFFDTIVLMGGPQSVADPGMSHFFKPYFDLVKAVHSRDKGRLIGVCLGAQIIAEALGGKVIVGSKGPEVGFSSVIVMRPEDKAFAELDSLKSFPAFHLHEDSFELPPGAKLLLSSEKYENQMFSIEDRIYGIQAHLEPSYAMLKIWKNVHKEFLERGGNPSTEDWEEKQKEMEKVARVLFNNLIED
jgi:GMP synthase-like glutamine amidotransferase